jgi:hypothetical protein
MLGQNSQAENLRGEVTNFGKEIDFSKDLTEGDINGYIAWRIAIWEDSRYRDRDLWIAFIDDFDDFKKDTFDIASKDYRIKLRDYLRANGVFVRKQPRLSIVSELCNVLMEDEQHKWTKEEIEDQINSAHGFNSILKSRLPAILTTPATTMTIPAPTGVTTTVPSLATTITGHGRELAKMYESKMEYGGALDSFDQIFHDQCGKAENQGDKDILSDEPGLHNDLEPLTLETDPDSNSDQSITTLGTIDGRDVLENLADKSTYHILTKDINTHDNDHSFAYTTHEVENKYTQKELNNIMIDTVSNWLTRGYEQDMAYNKCSSVGTITINPPPTGRTMFNFHVVDADTLFLLCLRDINQLGILFDSHPMHGKSPSRFLHYNADFNYFIYIDVMLINNHPLLHVVDEDSRFQAAHWLRNLDKSDESPVDMNFNWGILTPTIKVLNARIGITQRECLSTGFITAERFITTDSFKKFLCPIGIG